MTRRRIQEFTRAVLSQVPRLSLAQARRKGIGRGKLIRVDHAHRQAEGHFARLFEGLDAAIDAAAIEAKRQKLTPKQQLRLTRKKLDKILTTISSAREALPRVDPQNTAAKKS